MTLQRSLRRSGNAGAAQPGGSTRLLAFTQSKAPNSITSAFMGIAATAPQAICLSSLTANVTRHQNCCRQLHPLPHFPQEPAHVSSRPASRLRAASGPGATHYCSASWERGSAPHVRARAADSADNRPVKSPKGCTFCLSAAVATTADPATDVQQPGKRVASRCRCSWVTTCFTTVGVIWR